MKQEYFDEGWSSYYFCFFDHPVMLPFSKSDFVGRQSKLIAWCDENVGKDGEDWQFIFDYRVDSYLRGMLFRFRRAEDATLFALRWV